MNNKHAASIVSNLKESLAPGNSTWGDKYPEAHAELFRVYGVDIALEIRDTDSNRDKLYMNEIIEGMQIDDDIPDINEMKELTKEDLWS